MSGVDSTPVPLRQVPRATGRKRARNWSVEAAMRALFRVSDELLRQLKHTGSAENSARNVR